MKVRGMVSKFLNVQTVKLEEALIPLKATFMNGFIVHRMHRDPKVPKQMGSNRNDDSFLRALNKILLNDLRNVSQKRERQLL